VSVESETDDLQPRLLFDQNLAPAHVRDFGLQAVDDEAVWTHAAAHRWTIVTKDDDFRQRSVLRGAPPRVIWLRMGNCRTAEVEAVLRARQADVLAFARDAAAALLILARRA
jgi:predicted nuclease of predicted toxin-antitoxin system